MKYPTIKISLQQFFDQHVYFQVPNPEETLNTPTPFQIGGIDVSKANGLSEDLSLALDKEALDLTDKVPLGLSDKCIDLVDKTSATHRSPTLQSAVGEFSGELSFPLKYREIS